jgi:esterase/lipase superfamily enzyme
MTTNRIVYGLMAGVLVFMTAACQPKVYLMPTPAVLATGEINPFAVNPNLNADNNVPVFYATNRIPLLSENDRQYTVFPDSALHFGIAHMRIGEKETPWEYLFSISTATGTDERPVLFMEAVDEMVSVEMSADKTVLSASAEKFFRAIDDAIADSLNKDLMVYVHGANSSVYRACAQAAQYRHFTGRNTVVLAFLWPSAENLLAYSTDVRHAEKTVPAFARLIRLLAANTSAEAINILAYSAGSQIVSPGLARVGQMVADTTGRDALRLGEVYFAAADVGIDTFLDNLVDYIDIPRSVTLTVNPNDTVLALAEGRNKVSRAGRPKEKDVSAAAARFAQEASNTDKFDVIGVDPETVPGLAAGAHDFWYAHPWISSDVLVQFSFRVDPATRGLTAQFNEKGLRYWIFPKDYPDRIVGIINAAREENAARPSAP